jgi:hypothetical protein
MYLQEYKSRAKYSQAIGEDRTGVRSKYTNPESMETISQAADAG